MLNNFIFLTYPPFVKGGRGDLCYLMHNITFNRIRHLVWRV